MSTPRHENESDVTKIKAAYPGYMWGLAYYSHVERTFQTASYYWGVGEGGGGCVHQQFHQNHHFILKSLY